MEEAVYFLNEYCSSNVSGGLLLDPMILRSSDYKIVVKIHYYKNALGQLLKTVKVFPQRENTFITFQSPSGRLMLFILEI